MPGQYQRDVRPYRLDVDHPALGEVTEHFPSVRTAIARARLHEAEGGVVVVLSPDGSPMYDTDEGML